MCFSEFANGAVLVTNSDQAVLLPPSGDPLRLAGRTQLARSEAIWGAVGDTVDHVELQDAARPSGVPVTLNTLEMTGNIVGPRERVFVIPVAAGPATITAFDANDQVIQTAKR
ncbi:MAG: hypothetical protein ACR2P2_15725 [Nakamurella sp.]